jgi:membrane protein implicated in regulation of membrane protease activity
MWLVYLIALVLGGGLLLVQVVSGAGHGADLHHDLGVEHVQGPGLLSTRSLVYALFVFGFVGTALHIPGLLEPGWALAVALLSAAASLVLVGYVFQVVGDPRASGAADLQQVKGRQGRVLVGVVPGRRGKVRLFLGGQTVDFMATSEQVLDEGAEVTVIDVLGDTVSVVPADAPK